MPIELKVPPVGESITEVVIGDWLKAEGDWVAEDEPIVVIESDKVNLEVPAPVSGFVTKILLQTEETATIGQILGHMEAAERPEGAATPAAPAPDTQASVSKPVASTAPARITPAARRLAAQSGVDPATVSPTGPGGRVLKEDVQRHTAKRTEAAAPAPVPAPVPAGMRQTETIRLSPMRKAVARHLLDAQQNMALLTTFNEIDMSAVMALRREHKETFIKRHGIKLGFMSFFVKAAVDALRTYPAVNARIEGTNAIYHHYHDIGVAIGGGRGLVVPVIRNAERLGFADIEKTISDFGQRARDNKIKLEELLGGTFSITNGGIYGSLLSTPIVNPPQSGILGMHGIKERPIAIDGQVVIRPMMYVALTYDHRLVDGREAVSFLKRIKEAIESPVRLLLEV